MVIPECCRQVIKDNVVLRMIPFFSKPAQNSFEGFRQSFVCRCCNPLFLTREAGAQVLEGAFYIHTLSESGKLDAHRISRRWNRILETTGGLEAHVARHNGILSSPHPPDRSGYVRKGHLVACLTGLPDRPASASARHGILKRVRSYRILHMQHPHREICGRPQDVRRCSLVGG